MDSTYKAPAQRPTLLTVVCILSFIWCGVAVIGGGLGYLGMKMMTSGALEEMVEQSGDANAIGQVEKAQAELAAKGVDAAQLANIMLAGIGLTIVVLVGVIMMWKLKRTGFFIYTGAQLLGVVLPVLMGSRLETSISGMMMTGLTILFIVLFGLNLKHMR